MDSEEKINTNLNTTKEILPKPTKALATSLADIPSVSIKTPAIPAVDITNPVDTPSYLNETPVTQNDSNELKIKPNNRKWWIILILCVLFLGLSFAVWQYFSNNFSNKINKLPSVTFSDLNQYDLKGLNTPQVISGQVCVSSYYVESIQNLSQRPYFDVIINLLSNPTNEKELFDTLGSKECKSELLAVQDDIKTKLNIIDSSEQIMDMSFMSKKGNLFELPF